MKARSSWDDDGGWNASEDEWNFDDIDKPKPTKVNNDVDYDKLDLNKLDDSELNKHKKKMDVLFEKNFIKPNDPKFVYDKRKEFKSTAVVDESWDDDDD